MTWSLLIIPKIYIGIYILRIISSTISLWTCGYFVKWYLDWFKNLNHLVRLKRKKVWVKTSTGATFFKLYTTLMHVTYIMLCMRSTVSALRKKKKLTLKIGLGQRLMGCVPAQPSYYEDFKVSDQTFSFAPLLWQLPHNKCKYMRNCLHSWLL